MVFYLKINAKEIITSLILIMIIITIQTVHFYHSSICYHSYHSSLNFTLKAEAVKYQYAKMRIAIAEESATGN